ncbi:hypothetical protein FHT03_001057 [Xanthomonas arboricola]
MHTTPFLRFTALRRYDVRTGIGDVVAVFFVPQQTGAERDQAGNGQYNRDCIAKHPRHG